MRIVSKQNGFTLMEVMIALVIVAILTAIAYPSYQDTVTKSRRAEAKASLLDLQNRMERVYIDYNDYRSACITPDGGASCQDPSATPPKVEILGTDLTETGYYKLEIVNTTTQTTYNIRAVPQGSQATNDSAASGCGNLTMNNQGTKGVSGAKSVDECW